jgi:hypothetical protein
MNPIPFYASKAITPHATNPILDGEPCRAIYVGGGGNAVVRFDRDSSDTTLNGLVAGQVYHFAITHVRATGTTATNLVALY